MIIENPTSQEFIAEIDKKEKVLVDFWATWCGPCRAQSPIVKDFEKETGITLISIDVDSDETCEIVEKFKVKSIPTLILFDNGEQINKFVGTTPLETLKKAFGV